MTPTQASILQTLYYPNLLPGLPPSGFFDLTRRGMFGDNSRTRALDVTDGLSNTIAIGERRQESTTGSDINHRVHWAVGSKESVAGSMIGTTGAMTNPGLGISGTSRLNYPFGDPGSESYVLQQEYGYGSWHSSGANFLFGDGSVHFLRNQISYGAYQALGSIQRPPQPLIPIVAQIFPDYFETNFTWE